MVRMGGPGQTQAGKSIVIFSLWAGAVSEKLRTGRLQIEPSRFFKFRLIITPVLDPAWHALPYVFYRCWNGLLGWGRPGHRWSLRGGAPAAEGSALGLRAGPRCSAHACRGWWAAGAVELEASLQGSGSRGSADDQWLDWKQGAAAMLETKSVHQAGGYAPGCHVDFWHQTGQDSREKIGAQVEWRCGSHRDRSCRCPGLVECIPSTAGGPFGWPHPAGGRDSNSRADLPKFSVQLGAGFPDWSLSTSPGCGHRADPESQGMWGRLWQGGSSPLGRHAAGAWCSGSSAGRCLGTTISRSWAWRWEWATAGQRVLLQVRALRRRWRLTLYRVQFLVESKIFHARITRMCALSANKSFK